MNNIEWLKINHFTGEPYKKNPKSGGWYIVDYVSPDFRLRISQMSDGRRLLTKDNEAVAILKTLKAAKALAEII